MKLIQIFTLLAIFSYCSSSDSKGFERGQIQQRPENVKPLADSYDVQTILSKKPQIRFPFRLGIYLDSSSQWRFNQRDKDEIYAKFSILKEKGIVSDLFFISDALVTGDVYNRNYYSYYSIHEYHTKLKDIRIASARYNADAVYVIRNYNFTEKSSNILSIFYLTIIGMWLSPGTKIDSSFYLSGSLWDVRNEYLYFTSEYEDSDSSIRPLVFSDEKIALEKAKSKGFPVF
ncbi:MAG: hypothetical protein SFU98_02080, partial [Leptospiraceae bacterium]|nr:hypothetical protein [Leptospiraceae bacterium]